MIHAAQTIVSLRLFPIIVQPIVGAIMVVRILNDNVFQEKDIQRIFHLLKKGILK